MAATMYTVGVAPAVNEAPADCETALFEVASRETLRFVILVSAGCRTLPVPTGCEVDMAKHWHSRRNNGHEIVTLQRDGITAGNHAIIAATSRVSEVSLSQIRLRTLSPRNRAGVL